MTAFLLDANVLIALAWPAHEAHSRVQQWFARNSKQGWATCPLTQAAFVRILSNPAFSPHAVTPQEALNVLSTNLQHPGHQFAPNSINTRLWLCSAAFKAASTSTRGSAKTS